MEYLGAHYLASTYMITRQDNIHVIGHWPAYTTNAYSRVRGSFSVSAHRNTRDPALKWTDVRHYICATEHIFVTTWGKMNVVSRGIA